MSITHRAATATLDAHLGAVHEDLGDGQHGLLHLLRLPSRRRCKLRQQAAQSAQQLTADRFHRLHRVHPQAVRVSRRLLCLSEPNSRTANLHTAPKSAPTSPASNEPNASIAIQLYSPNSRSLDRSLASAMASSTRSSAAKLLLMLVVRIRQKDGSARLILV